MKSFEERKTEIRRRSQLRLAAIHRNRRTAALCISCLVVIALAAMAVRSPSEQIPVQPQEPIASTTSQTFSEETTDSFGNPPVTVVISEPSSCSTSVTTTISVYAPVTGTSKRTSSFKTTHTNNRTTSSDTTSGSALTTVTDAPTTTTKMQTTTTKAPTTVTTTCVVTTSSRPTTTTTVCVSTTTTRPGGDFGWEDVGSPPGSSENVPPEGWEGPWPPEDWEGPWPPWGEGEGSTTTTTTTTATATTATTAVV